MRLKNQFNSLERDAILQLDLNMFHTVITRFVVILFTKYYSVSFSNTQYETGDVSFLYIYGSFSYYTRIHGVIVNTKMIYRNDLHYEYISY